MKISLVVNTWNEEANIERCLSSVQTLADEIVVIDMESSDRTHELASKFTDKIYTHSKTGYVEPARNFAINKATGDWILILDADEVITASLASELKKIIAESIYDFVRLPRKNLVFGKWLKHSGWWPDYKIRFFKKGMVSWNEEIHSIPITRGNGFDLPAVEENAIVHYHYTSISQFLERLNRYTNQEAKQLIESDYQFELPDLIRRPTDEFLSRFFVWEGYKDGLHGLVLSLLQSFSFLITYLKVWEKQKFPEDNDILARTGKEIRKSQQDFNFWYWQKKAARYSSWKKYLYKIFSKLKI